MQSALSLFHLQGRTAVVTGGGVGLGLGMARGLAQAGANLVLISQRPLQEDVKAELASYNVNVHTLQADLSVLGDLAKIAEQSIALAGGKVDILINNAGIIRRTPAADHPLEDWHDVLRLNLDAAFYLCQQFGKHMIANGYGKIINIASMLSYQGGINVPGYTASKHGIAGITKALANEWASKGVNVNAIAPGYMATDNTSALRQDEQRSGEILGRIPAHRWGTPEDLAGAAIYLSSSASDYVNGHVLCVDGGWMNR
ncbi:MAG: 2-dehydro-3-deoxy-D-gluconate 5-dehydrogenase KduD [Paenibacillus sp.]|nr:2-dehydro-3-deoxy-D-gluconate 5-dehydrogenase KduD [Paenibacillus sp.]